MDSTLTDAMIFLPSFSQSRRSLAYLCLSSIMLGGWAKAQEATTGEKDGWQRYDWLKDAEDKHRQEASGESLKVQTSQDISNPFAVVSGTALDQQKYATVYTRRLADTLSLSFESSSTLLNETSTLAPNDPGGSPDDLALGQKFAVLYQPLEGLKVQTNLHQSASDVSMPGSSTMTTGAGVYVETQLPTKSTLTFGLNSDRTGIDASSVEATEFTAYDVQLQQPIGNLPLTAILKAHYEQIQMPTAPTGSMPSLEQSLVWKPLAPTTIQTGLRQQQYQEYPGIDNKSNQALFADWSQKITSDLSWRSYAEVVNTKGMVDTAPASATDLSANGTAAPAKSEGLTNTLPVSLMDQTVTFTTGPSFKLEKDISASVEYSNRWDKTPAVGNVGQEQRVSVSVKGSF